MAKTIASSEPELEALVARLRADGLRITTPRRLLLDSLVKAGGSHRTADDLVVEIQQRVGDVTRSTIYRNLEELERSGLVEHTHLGHGAATYHLAQESHSHLVCTKCSTVIEVGDEMFRALQRAASKQYGFVVDSHHSAIFGRCAECAAQHGESEGQ